MSAIVSRDEAVRLLKTGGVVAVPTDTVYGLAASLAHPSAVASLFAMKRRPTTAALPIVIDALESIEGLEVTWPENARRLSDAFWPGALTIIVRVSHELALLVGSSVDTAGFRIPNDQLLLSVVAETGPLAVSSANEHGEPPCQSAEQVRRVFIDESRLVGVLNDGTRTGEVSTVVEVLDAEWRILRHGALRDDEVAKALF